jgi:DNA invertase Pin-like site-specific DNA recombinase
MFGVFAGFVVNISLKALREPRAEGAYKGRPASIAVAKVRAMKAEGIGATEIAKALGIGRASVYRALGQ